MSEEKPFLDNSLWSMDKEISDFYPFIADGQKPSNIDWSKLDYDDATEYYSKKFNKFPDEIIEILNKCHIEQNKNRYQKNNKKSNKKSNKKKDIVKITEGMFTVNFD
jgi:hypothetical protein